MYRTQAYKYVPYGPVHAVVPYLIRRAEENSDMLGGAAVELELVQKELKRRAKEVVWPDSRPVMPYA